MLKIIKNKTFIAILLCIGFFTVGVKAATMYYANSISYTPSDKNWNVTNVESALNDLYNEKSNNSINVGVGSIKATAMESVDRTPGNRESPKTAVATYTPKKDCFFMCHAYIADGGMTDSYITTTYATLQGGLFINKLREKVSFGREKANETITCSNYLDMNASWNNLYVEIYTDEE